MIKQRLKQIKTAIRDQYDAHELLQHVLACVGLASFVQDKCVACVGLASFVLDKCVACVQGLVFMQGFGGGGGGMAESQTNLTPTWSWWVHS